tara:strand:- start:583 stop:987 length:405 start_codon:yes stop_codon:yes gene_type:complete
MGERAQVRIEQTNEPAWDGENNPDVYLYTHWGGQTILEDVAAGLVQGRTRWGDCEYLTRIILDSLIGDHRADPTTGFGIGTCKHLDIDKLVTIFPAEQQVQLEILLWSDPKEDEDLFKTWNFEEFIGIYGTKNP